MKVIFLDVDGVLNNSFTKARAPSGVIGVEADNAARLGKIVKTTGAVVVLTSTWQKNWMNDDKGSINKDGWYLIDMLAKHEVKIFGITGRWGYDRGRGIDEWLRAHSDVESWVVIDDEVAPDFPRYGIMNRLIITSRISGGLSDYDVREAIKVLGEKKTITYEDVCAQIGAYETIRSARCYPIPAPMHDVIDENKSVKWNREEAARRNKEYNEAVTQRRQMVSDAMKAVHDAAEQYIVQELGISKDKAEALWSLCRSTLETLQGAIELADDLVSIFK